MATVLNDLEIAPLVLHFRPAIEMTEDQFFEFCQINRDLRIERTAQGDILIMAPAAAGVRGRSGGYLGCGVLILPYPYPVLKYH